MKELNRNAVVTTQRPIRIMQFGEGNFLRAFVDWMIDHANKKDVLNSGIVVVQPLEMGMVDMLKAQDNLYHVYLEGIKDKKMVKEVTLVESIQDALNPYAEFEKYQQYILSEELEFVISNTTEAGIKYHDDEDIFAKPAKSFPGKVVALLYSRFEHFKGDPAKGLTFICCELIENNATTLKEYVLRHAERCNLGTDFISWVKNSCTFCDTLVDRIVPGFPRENIDEIKAEIGFNDNLVVKGEYYHVWAIAGGSDVQRRFPLDKAGLHVLFLDDIKSFRDKKVRILNGSHTALVPVGLQLGFKTVKEAFDDKLVESFINKMVAEEVLPVIDEDQNELKRFSESIIERFYNPAIKHYLETISLNSLSKWETRNFPTLKDCYVKKGKVASLTAFSLAALLTLYCGKSEISFTPNDTPEQVKFIQTVWNDGNILETVSQILSNREIWKENLMEVEPLAPTVAGFVQSILSTGMRKSLEAVLDSYNA
jgi:tagaturonate reductase